MIDLQGGSIPLVFTAVAGALPHIQNGRIKGIGVTSAARAPSLPNCGQRLLLAPIIHLALLMMLFIGLSLAMPMRADWRRVVIGHAKARVEFRAASDDFLARYGHARMFARRPRPVLSPFALGIPSDYNPSSRRGQLRDTDGGPRLRCLSYR